MKKDTILTDLRRACDRIAIDQDLNEQVAQYCFQKFNVPLGRTKDITSDRIQLNTLSDEDIFFLTSGVDDAVKTFDINNYYDQTEIKNYKKCKYQEAKLNWPIAISCFPVDNKQWIGIIDAALLNELNKANMINYNPNKQRGLIKIINGDSVEFKEMLIQKSVNQIQNLMEKNEYIPDDITLDIPEESDPEYEYDDKLHTLYIHKLNHFDITDGYHRFRAILQCLEKNPNFNYPMEVRVTAFSEQRTRQFIYQKDQKNKLQKSDSKSLNIFRYSNEVVSRLNERGNGCLLNGLITRDTNSKIDSATLSDLIEYYWLKPSTVRWKKVSNIELIQVTKEVKEILNRVINEDPEYLGSKYLSFKHLIVLFWLIKEKEYTPEDAINTVGKLVENGEINKVNRRTINKALFDSLESINLS